MTNHPEPNDSGEQDSKGFLEVMGFSKTEAIFWILYIIVFAGLGYLLEQSNLSQTSLWISIAAAVILVIWVFVVFRIIRKKERAVKIFANLSLGLIGFATMFAIFVYTAAPAMMFYPHFDETSYSVLVDKEEAEELSFAWGEGVISGWFWHNAKEGAPTIIYFAGNGENASTRFLRILKDDSLVEIFEGYQVVFLDYPGYGLTSGTPSEESFKEFGLPGRQ